MIDPPLTVRPSIVVASCQNVVVACSHGSITVDDLRALNQRYAQVQALTSNAPFYSLLLIGSGARPPSAEVRSELSQSQAHLPSATAVVIGQNSIPIALVRSVMATVQFLSWKSVKVDAFRDFDLAYDWLAQRAKLDKGMLPGWVDLAPVVERVRTTVPR